MAEELEEHKDQKAAFMRQMEELRPDLFYPEIWEDETRKKASELVRGDKVKTNMFSAIPINCRGPKCVYAKTCPLLKQNIAPEGSPCPIEMSIVQQFFQDYVEELGVDTTRMVEVSMVRDLVDQEVQIIRVTKLLADEHFIQENIVGMDKDGRPLIHKELHMAVELEDKIHKRKDKLRAQLLATREAKAKVGQMTLDTAQTVANLLEQVQEMDREREKLLRKKLGIAERDDYIEAHKKEE